MTPTHSHQTNSSNLSHRTQAQDAPSVGWKEGPRATGMGAGAAGGVGVRRAGLDLLHEGMQGHRSAWLPSAFRGWGKGHQGGYAPKK